MKVRDPDSALVSRRGPGHAQKRHQRGQAALMTYLFAAVLVISALSLFRTGRLTSDKMEMQNAADALAFGVSTVEARDLNFAAYTNRAIVANEVAIGQAIGLASWAYHWVSIGDFILEYNKYLTGPTLTISNSVLPPLASVFQISGGVFVTLMRGYAKAMTAVNHNVNKGYGIAQQIYHLASIVNTLGLLDESIKANAPDGAHMSGYGVLMLLAHLSTYGGLPVPVTEKFTQSYNPKADATAISQLDDSDPDDDDAADSDTYGYGRLAALIHNSGDPFTKGHHNPPYHEDADLTGRGWVINFFSIMRDAGLLPAPERVDFSVGPLSGYGEFGVYDNTGTNDAAGNDLGDGWLGFAIGAGVDFGVIGADIDFYLQLRIRMLREGGSELRATIPIIGEDKDKAAGELFAWSSADSTNFDLGFRGGGGFDAWIDIPFIGKIDLISADVIFTVANENMFLGVSFGGSGSGCSDPTTDSDPDNDDDDPECGSVDESADVEIYNGSFPTSAPLGGAFTWTGKSTGTKANALTVAPQHMGTQIVLPLPFDTPTGPIPPDAYGHAAQRLLGWYYPPSTPAGGIYWQPGMPTKTTQNVGSSYKGLPRYLDTTGAEPLYKTGGPFFIAALTLDQPDFALEHYDSTPGGSGNEPVGRFQLDEAFAWDSLSAVAKSEVYFDRPLDIDYFARGDGYVEHGSAFNPYWQARLIETSHADRVIALLLQHGELAQGISFGANLDGLVSWVSSALGN